VDVRRKTRAIKVSFFLFTIRSYSVSFIKIFVFLYTSLQMHKWYWFGVSLDNFLFPGYNITTIWGLVATCLGLAALAIFYEAMKIFQIHLQEIGIKSVSRTASTSSESSSLLSKVTPKNFRSYTRWYILFLTFLSGASRTIYSIYIHIYMITCIYT